MVKIFLFKIVLSFYSFEIWTNLVYVIVLVIFSCFQKRKKINFELEKTIQIIQKNNTKEKKEKERNT